MEPQNVSACWHPLSDHVSGYGHRLAQSYMSQSMACDSSGMCQEFARALLGIQFYAEEIIVCGGRSKTSSTPLSEVFFLSLRTLGGKTLHAPTDGDDSYAWGCLHAVPFPLESAASQAETSAKNDRLVFIGCREICVASESQIVSPSTTPADDLDLSAASSTSARRARRSLMDSPSSTPSAQFAVEALEWDQRQHTWLPLGVSSGGAHRPSTAPVAGDPQGSSAPLARELACSAAIRKRIFLFGGLVRGAQRSHIPPQGAPWARGSVDGSILLNDLWVLNVEKRRWKVYSCTGTPPSHRYGACLESHSPSVS